MLEYKCRKITEPVHVLKDQVSQKVCVDLGLVSRIAEMATQPANLKEEVPQLFTGLGKLKTEY